MCLHVDGKLRQPTRNHYQEENDRLNAGKTVKSYRLNSFSCDQYYHLTLNLPLLSLQTVHFQIHLHYHLHPSICQNLPSTNEILFFLSSIGASKVHLLFSLKVTLYFYLLQTFQISNKIKKKPIKIKNKFLIK